MPNHQDDIVARFKAEVIDAFRGRDRAGSLSLPDAARTGDVNMYLLFLRLGLYYLALGGRMCYEDAPQPHH